MATHRNYVDDSELRDVEVDLDQEEQEVHQPSSETPINPKSTLTKSILSCWM